jgi:hypothetical protein
MRWGRPVILNADAWGERRASGGTDDVSSNPPTSNAEGRALAALGTSLRKEGLAR